MKEKTDSTEPSFMRLPCFCSHAEKYPGDENIDPTRAGIVRKDKRYF